MKRTAQKLFARNMRAAMDRNGLTFRGLSESSGISFPHLNRIATEKADPSLTVAERISNAVGVPLISLLSNK